MSRLIGRAVLSVFGGAVLLGMAWWTVNYSTVRRLQEEKAELQRVVSRLNAERRVAQVLITGQTRDAQDRVVLTTLEFTEIDRSAQPLATRTFQIAGDTVYFDALVVRFGNEYVERGDELRGHSLHLFRRIFGEHEPPNQGRPLDAPNEIPPIYRTRGEPSKFERDLWNRFWDYCSDPDLAASAGVRLAQGEAVYQRVRAGQYWKIVTRADGGLEISPEKIDPLLKPHLPGS